MSVFHKLHPYCRSERGIANKYTAQHRPISSAQVALGTVKSLVATNHGPLISAPFTFSCVLPCANVAGNDSRPQGGAHAYCMKICTTHEKLGIGKKLFAFRPQYGILEPRISWSNAFVRALSSRGGSNAPRPSLSVSYLAVNTYGLRETIEKWPRVLYWTAFLIYFLDLEVWRDRTNKTSENTSTLASCFVPITLHGRLEAFALSYYCCVVAL